MNKREILILRYLSTTINRLELVRSHLTEMLVEGEELNPTVTDEQSSSEQGESILPLNELLWEIESKLGLVAILADQIPRKKTSSSDTKVSP